MTYCSGRIGEFLRLRQQQHDPNDVTCAERISSLEAVVAQENIDELTRQENLRQLRTAQGVDEEHRGIESPVFDTVADPEVSLGEIESDDNRLTEQHNPEQSGEPSARQRLGGS